MMMKIFLANDS